MAAALVATYGRDAYYRRIHLRKTGSYLVIRLLRNDISIAGDWPGWALCVAVMSLHGFGTELIQTFTGRHGCWLDVGIDHIGITTGLLLGGLGYRLFGGRPIGGGMERVMAAPQMQGDAGRKDPDADPL